MQMKLSQMNFGYASSIKQRFIDRRLFTLICGMRFIKVSLKARC